MTAQILIIDDDEKICRLISRLLRRDGYDVTYVLSAIEAIEAAAFITVDLIVTDIMMPEMNGREFCEMLRSGKTNFCKKMPIIMVSALYETPDRVGGIADGGDDYLVKPFEPEELSVRVQALLRRSPPHRDIDINILYDDDGCTLNMQTQCLHIHDIVLELSDKEALFLKMLIQSVNVPINKHEITRHLYPEAINSPDSRTAEVMIGRLRKKLEENNCQKIITKRGDGYYWQVL